MEKNKNGYCTKKTKGPRDGCGGSANQGRTRALKEAVSLIVENEKLAKENERLRAKLEEEELIRGPVDRTSVHHS